MEDVDVIRRNNLQLLMDLGSGTITYLANESGINRSTLSSVMNGSKMLEKHARLIERVFDKPFSWLDIPHHTKGIVEYDRTVLSAALKCLYGTNEVNNLYDGLSVRGKTKLLDKLYLIFTDPAARELQPRTIKVMLGIIDDKKEKRPTESKQASPRNDSKNK